MLRYSEKNNLLIITETWTVINFTDEQLYNLVISLCHPLVYCQSSQHTPKLFKFYTTCGINKHFLSCFKV